MSVRSSGWGKSPRAGSKDCRADHILCDIYIQAYTAFMIAVSPDDRVFILTGAGVSAESGIPTFRGVNGLWRNYHIEDVASPHAWARDPRLVWEFYSMRRQVAGTAKPNPAHFALAKLEQKLQDRLFLCTQNVDNLHEQAGSKNIVHMHGELFKSRCDTCNRPPFEHSKLYEPPAELPLCECGGRIRPHICWFGEMPFDLDRVFHALDECTIFMAIGTSGVVEPAASFVAQVGGAVRTIYVGNRSPQTHLRSRNAIWGKRAMSCQICWAYFPHEMGFLKTQYFIPFAAVQQQRPVIDRRSRVARASPLWNALQMTSSVKHE
jgi:NAD-dependent protein deacetylase/lipoamidase